MAQLLTMPKLSDTMAEGRVLKWVKKEGDRVAPGDVIAEVETDKANMDWEAFDEGVLLKQLVGEGATAKVGAPLAVLGESGEDVSALIAQARGGSQAPTAPKSTAPPQPTAQKPDGDVGRAAPSAPRDRETASIISPSPSSAEQPRRSSPLARRLADELGMSLDRIQGSGPRGRIVVRDVEAAAAAQPPARKNGSHPPPEPAVEPQHGAQLVPASYYTAGDEVEVRPLSMMRKTIATRLSEAKATIPHFYLTTSCDAEPLSAFRAQIIEASGEKISVNDLVLKATALALRKVPDANAHWSSDQGGEILVHRRIHLGVAVAVEDGLITPVVRDADIKSIGGIAREVKELADRARQKRLRPEEYRGATFSVSNLGMFGIEQFEAIINPPEAGILAVGAVREQPVVRDGAVVVGRRLGLSLSCDHRVIDGALGARFLRELVVLLEHPWSLAI